MSSLQQTFNPSPKITEVEFIASSLGCSPASAKYSKSWGTRSTPEITRYLELLREEIRLSYDEWDERI